MMHSEKNFSLKPITGEQLQAFYDAFPGQKTFLQTPKYGDFRSALGEKNFRYGIYSQNSDSKQVKMIGVAQFQRIPAKRGIHLHLPHGPLIQNTQNKALAFFLSEYKRLGHEQSCDFVRISSLFEKEGAREILDSFKKEGFRDAPVHLVNPEKTWVLDITQSEEDILKNMRKSTRYEVRRSGRGEIKTRMGNKKEDLEIFWKLHTETVKRQNFIPFARQTTEKELEIFGNDVQIFSAEVEQIMCSSSIIIFDSHAAYYHQGASTYSKLPCSHSTLWDAIREAKRRGCTEFNFWGVCDEDEKDHPWYGLSRFKRGFGGEERNFLHAQDFPLTKKYWLNWTVEKYRKWKRNY
ncbi:peptidoglycan bridge formation glycyltransferase FemA/FemB family protein [Candidatus Gracilibacteria bacterium]|nr:peptidoglycan bridge formation glycyltransferase FemA/FemB family protein [Candidatus Gracilibacteria bacterium]MCF7819646.1 peptidoglycan bridge formation glycyltransferase FemA/FemB family protein [Candidatus Gracilibacteria bacterium]